jgi:hypothetical protein
VLIALDDDHRRHAGSRGIRIRSGPPAGACP